MRGYLTHRVHSLDGFGLKITNFPDYSEIRIIFCNKDDLKQDVIKTNMNNLHKHLMRLKIDGADVIQIGGYGYWYTTMLILI
jgi:hypothetical protein